ncbi:metal-dependent hydrolase [Snuella sedimenti]|uniref:Metal-dependent hydrolase n=1 Tax=Snuella sedimenti TaxID=2798802 RepID=A0A8J7IF32_9FLAO|nr:metal-dependent hydrolase [Snuella sedimenti]MBJ6367307.1 metal-dependent hydrolase [Snuella sedimenti]
MDSLTQIVLGAACGEAVLGKKIGNKALLFGAIGGTIPDLDVYVGNLLYGNAIDAMLFHRGFMHSILFSVIGAFCFGWLAYKFYNSGRRLNTTTQKDWIWICFLALFTHIVLDCFTPYGTQMLVPFSESRIALNNIAVVDPIYTLPFLVCMIVLMFFKRTSKKRRIWLKLGVGVSTAYMVLTLCNKLYVNYIFKQSLIENNIPFSRCSTQPAIFNNVLWYGIAETDTTYAIANYSLLDTKNRFLDFKYLPKQRAIQVAGYSDLRRLAKFSNGYYSIYKIDDETYQYNDYRYPLLDSNDPNSSVFNLQLFKENDRLNMKPFKPKFDNFEVVMSKLWQRIKGI